MTNENNVFSIFEKLKANGLASASESEVKVYLTDEDYKLIKDFVPKSKKAYPKGEEWD